MGQLTEIHSTHWIQIFITRLFSQSVSAELAFSLFWNAFYVMEVMEVMEA